MRDLIAACMDASPAERPSAREIVDMLSSSEGKGLSQKKPGRKRSNPEVCPTAVVHILTSCHPSASVATRRGSISTTAVKRLACIVVNLSVLRTSTARNSFWVLPFEQRPVGNGDVMSCQAARTKCDTDEFMQVGPCSGKVLDTIIRHASVVGVADYTRADALQAAALKDGLRLWK